MIRIKGKEIIGVTLRSKTISMIYRGAVLVWQAVHSCFGSGTWRNDKPWLNKETWKNF